ncbi:MAG TPA: hypothetical protein VHE13_03040, partial [Opitutus sp.]|nr:hypothetical protein [Opitutus sp.]
ADDPAPAAPPPRHTPHLPRRGAATPRTSVDPALVFKLGKWIGLAVVAALIVWGAISLFRGSPDRAAHPAATTTTTAAPAASPLSAEPTITLVALDNVRVKVVTVDGSRVLLPDTMLTRGQTQVVPKPGPIYITYSAGKNLEVEISGKRYPMPTAGWDRAQIK